MQALLALDLARGLRGLAAIFEVADDGRAERGEMDADLVGAARHRLGGDPGIVLADLVDHHIVGDGMLGVGGVAVDDDHLLVATPALLGERELDRAALLFRHAAHQRPVDLLRIPLGQRLGQRRRRGHRPRHDEDAGGVAVEPVDEARALLLAEGQMLQQAVHMLGDAAAALRRKAGGFVENHDARILMDHKRFGLFPQVFTELCTDRLWRCGAFRGTRQLRRDSQDLACGQPIARLGALAVHPHLALAQQLLELDVVQRRVVALEPAIHADAVIVFLDRRRARHQTARTRKRPANSASTESTAEPIMYPAAIA